MSSSSSSLTSISPKSPHSRVSLHLSPQRSPPLANYGRPGGRSTHGCAESRRFRRRRERWVRGGTGELAVNDDMSMSTTRYFKKKNKQTEQLINNK